MPTQVIRTILVITLAFGLLSPLLMAQEDEPGKASPGAEKSTKDDRYAVPDADVPGLFEFIETLKNFRPRFRAEAIAHAKQASAAIRAAAEKILEKETDHTSPNYKKANLIRLSVQTRELYTQSTEERNAFTQKVLKAVEGEAITREQLQLGLQTASILEQTEENALAIKLYENLAEKAAKSSDAKFVARAEKMQGAIRRLNLVGHTMRLKGQTVAGKPFDLQTLNDKVVLVDFWATWCGPCISEIPNMRKMYAAYHEKGFEIVGVSIDDDRTALEDFLADEKLPWIILHNEADEGKPAAAIEYGVSGIPCMILVGKSGKVINIHARGENLAELLEKELGGQK